MTDQLQELVADALAKVAEMGTVGAMKWLALAVASSVREEARNAALEEAAKVCVRGFEESGKEFGWYECAEAIRSLKSQPAAPEQRQCERCGEVNPAEIHTCTPIEPSSQTTDAALTSAEIEAGWHDTFSTRNPFCPCDLSAFTKSARWAERAIRQHRPDGISWDGKNVYGDRESIDTVKLAIHDAGTVPELKDRLRELQSSARHEALLLEHVAAKMRAECAEICQRVANSDDFDGHQQYAAAACRDEILRLPIPTAVDQEAIDAAISAQEAS